MPVKIKNIGVGKGKAWQNIKKQGTAAGAGHSFTGKKRRGYGVGRKKHG